MNKKMVFQKNSLAVAVAASSVLMVQSSLVVAQSDAMVLEEVIVTANAREQSVTDIPYNISAIQGEDIADRQIFTSTELLRSVPGVYVPEKGQRNAGIARGRLDDDAARLDRSGGLHRFDHRDADAVFDGSPRVEVLAFAPNRGPAFGRELTQANDWRFANEIEDTIDDRCGHQIEYT